MKIHTRNDREKAAVEADRRDALLHALAGSQANPIHPQLGGQMADWLEAQEWDSFVTLTYGKFNPTVRTARRQVERLFATAMPKMAFWVTEKGDRFGRVHNHALVLWNGSMFGPRDAEEYWEFWWRRRAGFAELEPYDREQGAAGYLGGYVTKKLTDYDLWLPGMNS